MIKLDTKFICLSLSILLMALRSKLGQCHIQVKVARLRSFQSQICHITSFDFLVVGLRPERHTYFSFTVIEVGMDTSTQKIHKKLSVFPFKF